MVCSFPNLRGLTCSSNWGADDCSAWLPPQLQDLDITRKSRYRMSALSERCDGRAFESCTSLRSLTLRGFSKVACAWPMQVVFAKVTYLKFEGFLCQHALCSSKALGLSHRCNTWDSALRQTGLFIKLEHEGALVMAEPVRTVLAVCHVLPIPMWTSSLCKHLL